MQITEKMSLTTDRICMEGLSFDDVLLIPAYSEVLPKEVNLKTRFSRNVNLDIPVVSAAMDTVTETSMAIAMAREGGIGVIHKNMSIEQQASEVMTVKSVARSEGRDYKVAAGVGITPDALLRASALKEAGVDAIVLDSAHAHSKNVVETLKRIKKELPGLDVVVGNVATADGAKYLVDNGADAVKVGIGPGSICTTRVIAGVGVPQLSAIYNVKEAIRDSGVPVIADGGIRYSGDAVKALAAGGDCVMCGLMFSGTEEAPGEVFSENGVMFKTYRGMGSKDAMQAGSSDRYFQSGSKKLVPEGIVGKVPYKGSVIDILYQLLGGIKAGMGYCGAPDLATLGKASFVRISENSLRENHPHDVVIAKESPNYKK